MGRKRIDLTGQKFGKLTVISLNEEVSKQKGQSYWNCKCDCENDIVVCGNSLKSGTSTTDCGCSRRESLIGQKFGRLTVISYNEEVSKQKGQSYWNCKCDCGNEKVVRGDRLKSGSTTSCGCYKKEKVGKTRKDITGMKFGRLTVIKRHGGKGKRWLCRCECGNEVIVYSSNLRNGHTTSCGCNRYEGLIGQKFGKLTVISYNEEVSKQRKHTYCNCKCECGNETVVCGKNLKSGSTISCGCLRAEDLTGKRFGRLVVISLNKEVTKQKLHSCWNCKCDCGNEIVVYDNNLKKGSTISCGCYRKEILYKGGITPISSYLRNLQVVKRWRKDTYTRENNKCQLTGKHVHGGNSDVHHLYGFNMIVLEAHELYNIQVKPQVKDYTEEELHKLEEYIASWHKDTSNAILLCEEVHNLFHSCKDKDGNVLYGYGDNTPEQYEEFKQRYLNGEFDNLLGGD